MNEWIEFTERENWFGPNYKLIDWFTITAY